MFELFVRRLPAQRGFLLAAGLKTALEWLEALQFDDEELDWLAREGGCDELLLDYLATFRFRGHVDAIPEGTAIFPDEPLLRVTAALPEAQLIESRLFNIIQFQTVIASKAARCVLAAGGKRLGISACAGHMVARHPCMPHGRLGWQASLAHRMWLPAKPSICQWWAPWRIHTCQRMTASVLRFRRSHASIRAI